MEQLNFDSQYDPEENFKTYTNWILTVGELQEALSCHSDDTLVKLAFRGETPMGTPINVSMPIQSIGNSSEYVDGEKKNLIYINGYDN